MGLKPVKTYLAENWQIGISIFPVMSVIMLHDTQLFLVSYMYTVQQTSPAINTLSQSAEYDPDL